MSTEPTRCEYRACRRAATIRLHFGTARADSGAYCEEHVDAIREVADRPGSILRGVAREERLDPPRGRDGK
jgi:hypothetical protein